jgi:DUF971 family protein
LPAPETTLLRPVSLSREGEERLVIEWNDGHRSVYAWTHLRNNCPCAGCREEKLQDNPFRVLKPSELQPLRPVSVTPTGLYAYKIVWNDGHDSGIFTLENLRKLCQCETCQPATSNVRS